MRKPLSLSIVIALCLLALPAATQMAENNIASVLFVKVKPGMSQQFEEGVKKHMELHRANKDTWGWSGWQVITGPNNGDYGFGVFDRSWADFDNPPVPPAEDAADIQANVAPYVQSVTPTYWTHLTNVSHPAPGVMPLEEVVWFHVREGKSREFRYLFGKFHEAIQKANWPIHYDLWQLANGGETPTFVLTETHANWASMKGPAKKFPEILEEAVGRQEAELLLERFDQLLTSTSTEMIRNRDDLSYTPPK